MVGPQENTGPDACRRDALHQLRYQGRGLQALIVQDSFIDINPDFRRKQLSDLYLRYVHVEERGRSGDDGVDVTAGKQRNHLDFDEQAVKGIVRSTASDAEIGPVAVQDGPSGIVYVIP